MMGGLSEVAPSSLAWMYQVIDQEVGDKDALSHDVAEAAQLLMLLGWVQRRQFAQSLASCGLTIPQFYTLVTIHHGEKGCTMGVLAEETHQCSATMTGIIDRLLKMGLVERARDESDRRLVMVRLTKDGQALLRSALNERLQGLREVLTQFEEGGRRHIIEALKVSVSLIQKQLVEEVVAPIC